MHGEGIYTYSSGKKYAVVYNNGKCTEKRQLEGGAGGAAAPAAAPKAAPAVWGAGGGGGRRRDASAIEQPT